MSDPTPLEVFQYYKILLTEVLTKHNPAGLDSIERLLKQFPGKEHQVYKQICKNCGVAPSDPPTADDFINGVPKRTVKAQQSDGKVSAWLDKNGFNKYAIQHQFNIMAWEEFLTISTKGRLIELGVIPKHAQLLLTAIQNIGKDQLNSASAADPLNSASAADPERKDDNEEKSLEFQVGEICYTKMIKGDREQEVWINAKITHVNDNGTFDIFVLDAKAHGVPPEAVNVPRDMLKKSSETVQTAVPEEKKNGGRPQILPGSRVTIFGLRSHTAYNGVSGSALMYMPAERRYQVRLDTGDVIAIKQRNVVIEKVQAQHSVELNAAKEVAMKKLEEGGTVSPADEAILSGLILKLAGDGSTTIDPDKLGEFAAGFLSAKKKLLKGH